MVTVAVNDNTAQDPNINPQPNQPNQTVEHLSGGDNSCPGKIRWGLGAVVVDPRGGPCQHELMCGCYFLSSGVMIGPHRPK